MSGFFAFEKNLFKISAVSEFYLSISSFSIAFIISFETD